MFGRRTKDLTRYDAPNTAAPRKEKRRWPTFGAKAKRRPYYDGRPPAEIHLGFWFWASPLFGLWLALWPQIKPTLPSTQAHARSVALFSSTAWTVLTPRQVSALDQNGNGISDTDDIIEGARQEARRQPVYKSAYYVGGYPPETEGVCTDVIWRAFQHAGYDLKAMIDADIKAHTSAYPRTQGKPDRHIDFRRVPNQRVFFKRHALSLTTELIPGDKDNLAQWQPGDIVTFKGPDHIAILSTKRNAEGLPYLIHNDGPWASGDDDFPFWAERGITGHFRFPKGKYITPPSSKPDKNAGPIINLSSE